MCYFFCVTWQEDREFWSFLCIVNNIEFDDVWMSEIEFFLLVVAIEILIMICKWMHTSIELLKPLTSWSSSSLFPYSISIYCFYISMDNRLIWRFYHLWLDVLNFNMFYFFSWRIIIGFSDTMRDESKW